VLTLNGKFATTCKVETGTWSQNKLHYIQALYKLLSNTVNARH
jgi:hypothetical protein